MSILFLTTAWWRLEANLEPFPWLAEQRALLVPGDAAAAGGGGGGDSAAAVPAGELELVKDRCPFTGRRPVVRGGRGGWAAAPAEGHPLLGDAWWRGVASLRLSRPRPPPPLPLDPVHRVPNARGRGRVAPR